MITIQIETDNDAFKGHIGAARIEVSRILLELSERIRAGSRGQSPTLTTTKLVDYNGQTVGKVTLTDNEERWIG